MPVRCHMYCKCTVVQRITSSIGSYVSDCLKPLCGVWWSHSATWEEHSPHCLLISHIYNNSSLTTSREPLYNLTRIPYDIWLSNRRTPLFVADEYGRERIYFRYWEHCLFHWASCKYLLHICLLFCLILSCKIYKHMHSYFMTLQIYSICNNYPTPPSWTYRIIQNCESRLHIWFHNIISVWPYTIVGVLHYSFFTIAAIDV